MLLNKGDDFPHRLVLPIVKRAHDLRDLFQMILNVAWVCIFERLESIVVVFLDRAVFDFCKFRNARFPYEQSQDVLIAVPALTILICANLPLTFPR